MYITKNGIEEDAELEYHFQPIFSYSIGNEQRGYLELDFLFDTCEEALDFIKPVSEKYEEPVIILTTIYIDDCYTAY